jgi:hypothetical protein
MDAAHVRRKRVVFSDLAVGVIRLPRYYLFLKLTSQNPRCETVDARFA